MNAQQLQSAQEQTMDLIRKSGLVLSDEERAEFAVNDFGLGNFQDEGFAFVDILRSERLRITVFVLLPRQALPQHKHPAYDNEKGKEETLRVLYGQTSICVEGPANNPDLIIPPGKEAYYTARHEIALPTGGQYTIPLHCDHWFQGGPEGSVNLVFQNRVDETKNIFTDPQSLGCPIKLTD